ncbi:MULTISPECIES: DUF3967 domain-containing protein [Bacillus cereus group]|uniref:DUF3967 domain-containing protein n=1 Tax=Bacillus cereus group TaxID=86661 RepID=UPI001F3481EA|nr:MULTISPECIES: DUF3967 domain-containing protein [Bacillus cereus group]
MLYREGDEEMGGNNQLIYSSKDVAAILKIQESTLRKYCIMLEEVGYKFHKNELGHRGFLNEDVVALKTLADIKSHPNMTLKQACNAVMTWLHNKNIADTDITELRHEDHNEERHIKEYNELKEMIQQQNEMLKQMAKKMDEQQRYIDERLERRDQQLMSAIREIQEEKKVLLEIAATQKKKWWQFWLK